MKKVLHLGYSHKVDDTRIYLKECRTLAENGYNVTYITSDANGNRNIKEKNLTCYTINNTCNRFRIRTITFWRYFYRNYAIRKKYLKEIEKIKPDIIHFHEEFFWPIVKTLKKKGYITVYDSHEDYPSVSKTYYKNKYGSMICYILKEVVSYRERGMLKHVDYVITATTHIKKMIRKRGAKVPTIVVNNYPLIEGDITSGWEISSKNIFCYAGGLSKERGLENMSKAIDGLNAKIFFAGNISDDLRQECERVSNKKAEFVGELNRVEINKLYNSSIAGLCVLKYTPNHYYSQPIKMFEYMYAGIPFICSNFPLWRKLVEKYKCGMCVNQDSVEEIRKAMIHIIENREEARKMGENGRKAVIDRFNWDIEKKKLIRLYERI